MKTLFSIFGIFARGKYCPCERINETQKKSTGSSEGEKKESAYQVGDMDLIPVSTHCSILAWEIQWTEEPGGLQSRGS